jgi:hypothetical protein
MTDPVKIRLVLVWCWWLKFVILATWEAEIKGFRQAWENSFPNPISKNNQGK